MKRARKKAITKKLAQRRHSIARAAERYGLDLTPSEMRQLVDRIQRNEAEFLHRQTHTRTLFCVDVRGQRCVVVYDGRHGSIRTFLPPIQEGQTVEDYLEQSQRFFQGY